MTRTREENAADAAHDEAAIYYACPECGCTDVEVSAWVHVNTNEVCNDEGPLDTMYCPQCCTDTGDGHFKSACATTDTLKPYKDIAAMLNTLNNAD